MKVPLTQVYTIYVLRDPRDNAVRYIGATRANAAHRLYVHTCSRYPTVWPWISELRALDLAPIAETLESFIGPRHRVGWQSKGWDMALHREHWWIQHYLGMGAKLLNRELKDRSRFAKVYRFPCVM